MAPLAEYGRNNIDGRTLPTGDQTYDLLINCGGCRNTPGTLCIADPTMQDWGDNVQEIVLTTRLIIE